MSRNDIQAFPGMASRRQVVAGAVAFGMAGMVPLRAWADDSGISHGSDAIHQEPVFKASRQQVYEALTDARKFDAVARFSDAMQSMATGGKATLISGEVGGAFALFGGYVVGRNLELVTNERIVQAWRSQSWKPGDYSIVRFNLAEEGSGTKIVFDHRGFPEGTAQHLAAGWKANYWEPLEKYFAQK
jgi:activator of HSP90 ATPase